MRGVSFNGFHSLEDFGLHLSAYTVPGPVPITHYIDIPGRKTKIDATEALYGGITYENRTLTFSFWIQCSYEQWMILDSRIQRAIGGKRCKIILDTEPDKYWLGRVVVDSERPEEGQVVLSFFTITCDVEPYKYWSKEPLDEDWLWDPFNFEEDCLNFTKDLKVSGSLNVEVCINLPTYPVITSSAAMSVSINGKTYQLKAGENELEDELLEGEYVFSFTGNGTVSIGWKGETL